VLFVEIEPDTEALLVVERVGVIVFEIEPLAVELVVLEIEPLDETEGDVYTELDALIEEETDIAGVFVEL